MILSEAFHEWTQCGRLRQSDIDRLVAAGVPVMALAGSHDGRGYCLARDRVVVDGGRFEFERQAHGGEPLAALIVLALDTWGEPVDLVAWRSGPGGFIASWRGRVGVLGEEDLGASRFPKPLLVHADPLDWLRAGRTGAVVVDAARAAHLLRDAGEIEVGSFAERRRLLDLMAVRLPPVRVRAEERRAAA